MSKVFKRIWMYAAIFIIFMAVLSSIFRALTPWAKEYKGEIEQHLSLLIGQPVTIQTIETGWYWFHPVLKLNQVTLGIDPHNNFHVNKLLVGINLLKSLWRWQIQPGVLYIDDMHLNLRERDAHWTIDGITTNALDSSEMTPEKTRQLLLWLSQQEHLIIKHVSAYFYFSDGGLIPVDGLNVSVANSDGHYKFKGGARLAQTSSTDFQLLGDGYFDPDHFDEIKGRFYFSATNIVPAQWQSLFPQTTEHLEGGKGNLSIWVDMNHGSVTGVQAQVGFKHLAWRLLHNQQSQLIQSFFANLSWKPDRGGWKLLADQVRLRIAGVSWPENQLLLNYRKKQQSYQLFVKSIIIESLLSHAVDWPERMHGLLKMNPQGILADTQILVSANPSASSIAPVPGVNFFRVGAFALPQINFPEVKETVFDKYTLNYVLTRFEQLGWGGSDSIPEVHHLSGVINWQPDQGRLELDSENTSIKVQEYPEQVLSLLNGAFDWKELNEGLRISMERFVVSQPELTVSMQGMLDEVSRQSIGHIHLNAEFSGKNWQQWAAFLPKKYLKPKLYRWLTTDLKGIAEASGKITVDGLAKDFPFDNHSGEFTIDSFASGGELAINSKWQVIKDIDGYIHLNKRNLAIDIIHADFQGVPVEDMHLRIDDIGNNKENLLVSGKINAAVQKMMNYILASPLKKKLSLLNMLSVKGTALLDLKVIAPLYPENDTVLAQGEVALQHNNILVRHELSKFSVTDLSGKLMFNETGVTDSSLTANIFDNPMNIKVQSVKQPTPATTITINGSCSVDSLKEQFKVPVFAAAEGAVAFNAELKLTDKPAGADSIHISSTLEGLAIHLPAPVGKNAAEQAPLELNLDFNAKESMRLRGSYDARLSANLLFKKEKKGLALSSGQLRLGSANAINQNLPGLSLVGSLKNLDVQVWKDAYARFAPTVAKASLLNKLRIINITIEKFNFLKQQFDTMVVKAKILPNQDWSFNLQQKMIAADLVYHASGNELSGHIQRLTVDKINVAAKGYADSLQIHPEQIPNLNLRIDNLAVNKLQIGNVTLKSQSSAGKFLLKYCRIDSPVYQFDIQGQWTEKNKVNRTNLDVALHVTHLANTLERWLVAPAVHAKKGDMEFHGGWNKQIYNFSLAAVNGDMRLHLKNGRITHLSKATEEKLGLGKLLSILSLQTIPRRLQLDFSDLSHEGYSFDIFQGDFRIKNGIMSTQDSYLDGPVAYAGMKGDLNLTKHTYNLQLRISPHITASLPVVATIAGGPVAGVAAWVANNIISQSMQKISGYTYKISGPWDEPVIQQLSMVKQFMRRVTF